MAVTSTKITVQKSVDIKHIGLKMNFIITHDRIDDLREIERLLKDENILLDTSDMKKNPSISWLLCKKENFVSHLDRNIISYIIALYQEDNASSKKYTDIHRLIAAFQFFRIEAAIKSDVTVAYHELIESVGIEKANKELSLLQSLDNVSSDIYLEIALGKISHIPQAKIKPPRSPILIKENPATLIFFKHNITYIKKAILIRKKARSDYDALLSLVDWALNEYIFTLPAFHFLSIYFSSNRVKKMLKSKEEKGIRNAAWDLCLIQQLVDDVKYNNDSHWLLSSYDEAVQKTALLVFGPHDKSLNAYFTWLEEEYKKMWGRNNNYGKSLLKKFILFTESFEKRQKIINYELIHITSDIVATEFDVNFK